MLGCWVPSSGWWYKPDYIINDININSAIASPAHNELVTLSGKNSSVTVSGYSYSGAHAVAAVMTPAWALQETRCCCCMLSVVGVTV